jgi:hypothetical protein
MLRTLGSLMHRRDDRRRRPDPWRALLERLEDRAVPAGNVIAAQFGTTLELFGDELGNVIQLRSGETPGEVTVRGVNTTVNGTGDEAVFEGVTHIEADLGAGDDWLKTTDLTLTDRAGSDIVVNGGAGDDRIELFNTTVHATGSPTGGAFVRIFGETMTAASVPTTGNDTIRLSGTSIISDGLFNNSAYMTIYGDFNEGGQVTGGNDRIVVTDTVISATGGSSGNQAFMAIYGDFNAATGNATSTIGQGDDTISVNNTRITAVGSNNFASATIYGDFNAASGTIHGAATTATIGEGNDAISVTGTTVATSGVGNVDSTAVTIFGDHNTVTGFFADTATTGTIGGGNDAISVTGTTVSAAGAIGENSAVVDITGDYSNVFNNPAGAAATVGGGNDSISVKDDTIAVTGPDFAFNFAGLSITGENTFDPGSTGTGVVGVGNDQVALRQTALTGPFPVVQVDTGIGNDRLDVTDSTFVALFAALGDGDDTVTFNSNTFEFAVLDGGPGYDRLRATGNSGQLFSSGFEEETVTP